MFDKKLDETLKKHADKFTFHKLELVTEDEKNVEEIEDTDTEKKDKQV